MAMMSGDEILALMRKEFPEVQRLGLRIDTLTDNGIAVTLPTTARDLRPGGTISGPAMMTLVDTTAYFLVLANVGPKTLAVTTNLNINFLRKPVPGDLRAVGCMLKCGSRLVVTEVTVLAGDSDEPVAHATVTYSVPPARS